MSSTNTTPLSSVPIQFIVRVQNPSSSCTSKPELVGDTPLNGSELAGDTPLKFNGSYLEVPFNTSWRATIIARDNPTSTCTFIKEIITASPLGMKKSSVAQSENPGEWEVSVTWTPFESQVGLNIFCYAAIDNLG